MCHDHSSVALAVLSIANSSVYSCIQKYKLHSYTAEKTMLENVLLLLVSCCTWTAHSRVHTCSSSKVKRQELHQLLNS
jgi:hypothetical protein